VHVPRAESVSTSARESRCAPPTQIAVRYVPIAALRPAPYNPRVMPDDEMAALVESIRNFGLVDPILVRCGDLLVVGGHQRLEAAKRLGLVEVPIVELDLTDEQAKALNVALNKIGGTWDDVKLAEILASLPQDLQALTGFDDTEMRRVAHDAEAALRALSGDKDPDAAPAPPDEAVTRPGDLWVLGEHRLLCGDAGDTVALDRLLAGAPIHLVNTDPPYNVKVEPRSNNAIAAGLSSFQASGVMHHQGLDLARHPEKAEATHRKLRPRDRPLENDFLDDDEFEKRLRAWFSNMARVLVAGRSFFIWGGYSNFGNYPPALRESGLYFSQAIVWDKEWPVLTRKDFMGAFEVAYYGWKEGAAHQFLGPPNVADLWHVKKVSPQAMQHLTEKPVELALRAIEYSSVPGENVLDLFGGSGSTLIACEQSKRRAFLMEIDPLYCDVIVRRYEAFSGKQAIRGTSS
jgi:DNA modification methylase